jgi:tellurite resistance protein TehA-like permease
MTCPNTISYKPFSHLQSREVIRQFTPNWFAATMGTGVLALALAQLPVDLPGLRALPKGCGCSTLACSCCSPCLYAARWVLFFDEARRIFGHSTVSMFFGTIPMGLATIINGFLVFGLPRWGDVMPWPKCCGGWMWRCRWPAAC